ncbi:M4 family metallopeptidase [Bordetella flabilis]|uniref:Neutral metalloproteinase n=1 Tax=Bordetella flabilis TaxID=463014 RepID=A0A193GG89_9BORD|nr:peptidase M4 [Bordetella flabilis]
MLPSPRPCRPARALLPPYLLDRLIHLGSPHVRASAADTLGLDGAPGSLRQTAQARAFAAPALRPAQAAPRYVHTADRGTALPGKLVRAEGQPATGDDAADEAYAYLGATRALFAEVYGRNSIDGSGMALVGTVHYGVHYDNAFWNGEQMVFGDGDGEVFNRFTIAMEVVAHELAHGIIDHEAALVYQGQAGALNESISDVFGVMVKQYHLRQTAAQADWLVGVGLFTDAVQARALRSMAAPGTAYDDPVLGRDPQPDHMRDFVHTQDDNGGVHINSGIPNRAFYLAAQALGGHAWEAAGRVWYDALCDPSLSREADFPTFAGLTLRHAADAGNSAMEAVRDAWQTVGVVPS